MIFFELSATDVGTISDCLSHLFFQHMCNCFRIIQKRAAKCFFFFFSLKTPDFMAKTRCTEILARRCWSTHSKVSIMGKLRSSELQILEVHCRICGMHGNNKLHPGARGCFINWTLFIFIEMTYLSSL